MKNQALFSSKDKSKKLKCRLLQFLLGTLWVNSKTGKTVTEMVVTLTDKDKLQTLTGTSAAYI